MKFWKKTVVLRLPIWSILAAVLVLIVLVGVLLLGQTNFWENLLLRTLTPDNISAVYIYDSGCTAVQKEQLSREDIAAVTEAIHEVRLSGKPYELVVIGGGPCAYAFTMKDGSVFQFGCHLVSNSYYYWLDGKYYYICSEGDGTDLSAFTRLESLYRQQSEMYFK